MAKGGTGGVSHLCFMPRRTAYFPLDDASAWKKRLLHWAAAHEVAVYLDSNQALSAYATWECLVGAGSVQELACLAGTAFADLHHFLGDEGSDWAFGFLAYDLKNEVECLQSSRPDGLGLPDLMFFQPDTVAGIRQGQLEIHTLTDSPHDLYHHLLRVPLSADYMADTATPVHLRPRLSKPDYLEAVEAIRQHIIEGDVYEMNMCQEFFAEGAALDPLPVFERLNALAGAPFSAFMRWRDRYLLCASPERFLKKMDRQVVSQPIKGTRRRGKDSAEDERVRQELAASEKDRAENVMIVDLVRNDLARHCQPGSVRTEELFGIHTFQTVHQMISTVSGTLLSGEALSSAGSDALPQRLAVLCDAFPMGSMTGAPKVMAMQLIEQYERTRRGLYSGSVGYFDPEGDFDFNVVIRSILYEAQTGYVSVQVGGAIVYDSDPEQEYEECLVKAEAMRRALAGV